MDDFEEIDIPPVSGVRGKLPNYTGQRKKAYKKIGNRRVRAGIRQSLRTLQPSKSARRVKGITAWDID